MVEQSAVLGVDGCPGGWVGALVVAEEVRGWYAGSFAEMLAVTADLVPVELVAVDCPIGLPTGGERRAADLQARDRLGPARSSVFFTPPRVTLDAATQSHATALSRSVGGKGVSIQTFWIMSRIAEVDEALCDPGAASRVVETHPEVSFRELAAGGAAPAGPLPRKTLPSGRDVRLALLRGWLPGLTLPQPRPGRATVDDCLDALVCAWSGLRLLRGEADVLGGGTDACGRPMRIVV